MLRKIGKIGLSIAMVLTLVLGQSHVAFAITLTQEEQTELIRNRLKEYFLELDTIDDGAKVETCYVSKAKTYLDMIQEDGSFADVKYDDTTNAANGKGWSPYLALDRLQAIAIAYHKEGNSLYHKQEVVDKMQLALAHWKQVNPRANNWWENEVGVQLRMCRIALFMDGIISDEAQNVLLTKMLEKKPEKYGTGQNNLWFDQNWVYHALITDNFDKLKDMVDNYLSYCLVTQTDDVTKEAVQVDNSFFMHGKQFYSNGYGMSMFRDMSFWIYMLRDTDFSLGQDVIDRMADYMLEGTRWTIRGDIIELYLGYRPYKYDVGYKNYAYEYIEPLKRMAASDPKHAADYQNIINNIEGKTLSNGKNGNYYMWRSGYASHMRDNYGVNVKMDSKDVIGGEWRGSWSNIGDGKDQGQLIYWTSSASSTISIDGTEYISVFPVFDWRHTPGTTTPYRFVKDYANYGRLNNGDEHMMGVSNGKYGATAYVMNKKDTQATKGYFFFDDEFVALGVGINSKETSEIHTTLNQSKADGVIVDGNTVSKGTIEATNTIYNDQIGYVLLNGTKANVSYDDQKNVPSLWPEDQKTKADSVFTAYVNHGAKPTNGSYAYVVVPNTTNADLETYAQKVPVTIVANNADIQAVRHDGLKQTQVNFYKAGTLEYKPGYTVTVDKPCSLIIDESSAERVITVSVNDTEPNKGVSIVIEHDGQKTITGYLSQNLPYAGQPVTLNEGTEERYIASSSSNGHPTSYAHDNDVNTYWESEGNGSEYISILTDSDKFIKNMNIVWGDNYATQYDVYGSKDGVNYTKISSVTGKNRSTESVAISGIYNFVKIVMNECSGANYQIKEVDFNESELLSLKKPVEVSSTSTNDPGNIKEKAVDGDYSTRWSSLRKDPGFDKQEEWITVDLERKALIDAVEVTWEGAKSNNYSIEVSNDNQTWTTVKSNLKTSDTLKDQIVFEEPVDARYVRVHSFSSATKYGISIFELSVYGDCVKENIALNKSVETDKNNDKASWITDGITNDNNKRWSTGSNVNDAYIIVDLEHVAYIDGFNIDWESACSDNYSIEVSNDKKTWTTVKEHLKANTVAADKGHFIDKIELDSTVEARYVKIHSMETRIVNGKNYGISIWELDVLGAMKDVEIDYGSNIALNKPSKASSVFTDSKDGNKTYYSSLAFDGSADKIDGKQSRWVSARKKLADGTMDPNFNPSQYVQVDLQGTYNLSKVVLNWEGDGAKEYKLQVSLDGQNWIDISHIKGATTGGIKNFTYEDDIYARYVRMQGIEPGGIYGYSLWEFEVYGDEVNIALNQPSEASSEYTNPNSKFTLESKYAFDGSVEDRGDAYQSRWVSARRKDNAGVDVDSQYIQVDLEEIYNLSKVILNWEGACGKEYKLQISIDGKTWTDISHVTDGKAGIKEFIFDEDIYGRYVRMQGIVPAGQYGYSLWEFEVYGQHISVDDVQSVYDLCKNIDKDLYTPDSVNAYTVQLDAIMEKYNALEIITDQDMFGTIKALKDVSSVLVERADFTELKAIIEEADKVNKDLYTDESVDSFEAVLEEAEKIVLNLNASQKDVDLATSLLKNAIDLLKYKDADYSKVDEAIAKANALNKDSYKDFSKVEEAVKAVVRDLDITKQKEVDEMSKAILTAIDNLVEKTDKDALASVVDKAENVELKDYTDESANVFKDAIENAKEVLADENATQEEVDKALKNLENAKEGLVLKEVIVTPKPDDDKDGIENENIDTSDNTLIGVYGLSFIVSIIGYAFLKRREEY